MEWFSGLQKGLQVAQEAALDAAEKAKVLASQASVQAMAYAEQAKVYAEQASDQAKVLAQAAEAQFTQLKQQAGAVPSSSSQVNECDLPYFGVTEEILQLVGGMSYNTFSDSSVKAPSSPLVTGDGESRLSAWQEKHVMLILARVEQLQHLRFALCPKRMDEQLFWAIYFSTLKEKLPPQAFGLPPEPSSAQELAGSSSLKSAAPTSSQSDPPRYDDPSTSPGSRRAGGPAPEMPPASSPAGASDGGEEEQYRGEDNDDDDMDRLSEEEEDDPELDAYLQEAMALEDEAGGGSDELGSDPDDLDDYINSLKEEDEA